MSSKEEEKELAETLIVVVPGARAVEVAKAALPFLDNVTRDRYIKETGQNPWAKKPGGG